MADNNKEAALQKAGSSAKSEEERVSKKSSTVTDRVVKRVSRQHSKFPDVYYSFKSSMQVIEYNEEDLAEDLTKSNDIESCELFDPWTEDEKNAILEKKKREEIRDDEPETVARMEHKEAKEDFEGFLNAWKEARQENEAIEEEDIKCMEKLQDLSLNGVLDDTLSSPALKEIFAQYRKLELEVRIFKNIKAVRFLRLFISKSSVVNVKKFLEFHEDYFDSIFHLQKDIGLAGRALHALPKLHSGQRHQVQKFLKFSSKQFKDEWLQTVDRSASESESIFSEDDTRMTRKTRASKIKKKKRKRPTFPYRWQGYIRLFADLNLEWKKLMRGLVENYLKCINTATVQALMNYDFDFNYGQSTDPLALIRFLFDRPIPKNMLKKPYIPPTLAAQFAVKKEPKVDDQGTIRGTKMNRYISPLLRTDRYYSRNRQACDRDCSHHVGKLFLLLINLGKAQVVKYCLEHGFKPNMKICGTAVKQMRWIEDFHPDEDSDDVCGIRVSTFEVTTPLATAAEFVAYGGDPEIVRILLKEGAKPRACNDLAIRQCVSSINRDLGVHDKKSKFRGLHGNTGPITARRLITATAFQEIQSQWENALKTWEENNSNAGSFKQKVAETKATVHLKYYFDVAHLTEALMKDEWRAVDTVLGYIGADSADVGSSTTNFSIQQANKALAKSKRLSKRGVDRKSRGSVTSIISHLSISAWTKEHPHADEPVSVLTEGSELSANVELPLAKISAANKHIRCEKVKILEYLIANRDKRSFSYTENRLLKTLRTLDRLLVAALKSSSKGTDNSLLQDAAGNSNYILSILILLEYTRFHVDNKRLKYLVALLVKAMTEFKPGDKMAIDFMLQNEQIRMFLKLAPKQLLCEDPRNVVNLIKDKKLLFVFDVPRVKQRKSINRKSVKTIAAAKQKFASMSRKLPGSGTMKRKKSLFSRMKKSRTNDALVPSSIPKRLSVLSGNQSVVTKSTKYSDNSKSSKASAMIGYGSDYPVEIEANLWTDLLVKAADHGYLDFIKELITESTVVEVYVLNTMMNAAMLAGNDDIVKFVYEYMIRHYGALQPEVMNDCLVRWLKESLGSDICSYSFLEILRNDDLTLNSIIAMDKDGEITKSHTTEPTLSLYLTMTNFIIDTVTELRYTNVPRNDIGNYGRKRCFYFLLEEIEKRRILLEKGEVNFILDCVIRVPEPSWSEGTRRLCEVCMKIEPSEVNDHWASSYMKKISGMKRPQTLKGRIEMVDLLVYFQRNVPSKGSSKMNERIQAYLKKLEHDLTGRVKPRRS